MVITAQEPVVLRIMREQGRSAAGLAKVLGVQRQLVYQLTHKTRAPEQPMLGRIALVLNVPVDTLVDPETKRWRT